MNAERLLNVARALRESANPNLFCMSLYHECGTPACALGHYAARRDLQNVFELGGLRDLYNTVGTRLYYDDLAVQIHFGITQYEAEELFSADGCGDAHSADAAAAYIEKFVQLRCPHQQPAASAEI